MESKQPGRHIDYHDLTAFEAVSIGLVLVASIFAGTSYAVFLTIVV